MDVLYLTADQILSLHDEALKFGGAGGIFSEQALFAALMQPQQSAFGEDAYPTIPDKAAAYGYFLTANHPFVDGNKRTALAATLVFLDVNGYEFTASPDECEEMFVDTAGGHVEQAAFFAWVAAHAEPRKER